MSYLTFLLVTILLHPLPLYPPSVWSHRPSEIGIGFQYRWGWQIFEIYDITNDGVYWIRSSTEHSTTTREEIQKIFANQRGHSR